MSILCTIYLSYNAGHVVYSFRGYLNVPCVLFSVGIFVFIKYDLVKIMKIGIIKKLVNFLDFYTFGIYLIHLDILCIFLKFFNINVYSIIYRLFFPIILIGVSVILIWLIRKIPIIKRIVPS